MEEAHVGYVSQMRNLGMRKEGLLQVTTQIPLTEFPAS